MTTDSTSEALQELRKLYNEITELQKQINMLAGALEMLTHSYATTVEITTQSILDISNRIGNLEKINVNINTLTSNKLLS